MFDVPDPDYIHKAETYGTDYMYEYVYGHPVAEEEEPEEEPVNEDDEYFYDN